MTQEQKLIKIIEKGVENGWKGNFHCNAFKDKEGNFRCSEIEEGDEFAILFDKSFAKAIWGDKILHENSMLETSRYKWHLMPSSSLTLASPHMAFFIPVRVIMCFNK